MSRLVNPRTGVVRLVQPFRGEPGDAPLCVVGAQVTDTARLGAHGAVPHAGGIGWTMREAEDAALGEAVERYCAAFVGDLRWACPRELDGAVEGWSLFSARQYAHPEVHFAPWGPDLRLAWVEGEDLGSGAPAWLPAQFVHIPYRTGPGEPLVAPGLTTGLGAGPTRTAALLSGLYEVVERDAFTLAWLQAARPPEVDPATEPPRVQALRRHARFRLLDLTHDVGLPTYLCVLEKPSAVGNVICVGTATRHDARAAAEKAVLEAFQCFPYIRELVRAEPEWRAKPDFSNLRDFRDHCRLYTVHPEHRPGIAHLLDGPLPTVPMRTASAMPPDAALRDAVARLARCGMRAYAAELTTPDVAAAGYRVARVAVPEAHPLHGSYQAAHLGGARLRDAARHLPYLDRTRFEQEVHAWPHPFA